MRRKLRALLVVLLIGTTAYLMVHYRVWPFDGNSTRNETVHSASGRTWATPLDLPGLPNGHRVSDDLYRGAQPTAEGLDQLRKLGVKTIISLRSEQDDRDLAGSGNFRLVHIRLSALNNPTDDEVRQFLDAVSDPANLPAFVHCREGADRTGTMCAVYRIVRQGWDRQAALDEMIYGGFHFHWWLQNLRRYIQTTDFSRFARPASAPATTSASENTERL